MTSSPSCPVTGEPSREDESDPTSGEPRAGETTSVGATLGEPGAGGTTSGGCPVRKLSRPGERLAPAVERVSTAAGERWIVRSFATARAVLRSEDAVTQGGFGAEQMSRGDEDRRPILYLEGPAHRSQRKASARYFTPKVTASYRSMMESLSEQLISPLEAGRRVDLSTVSLRMAVQVAARVVGLTDSWTFGTHAARSEMRAMGRRLERFFDGDLSELPRSPANFVRKLNTSTAALQFYWLDVKPAIRARRRQPQDDVISGLLERGYSDLEIFTECVTYAAAGMVTTREFISVAAWHLLDHPALLEQYRSGDADERLVLLQEILRLEPVVGHLFRRTTAPLTLPLESADGQPDGAEDVPIGSLIDLDVRAINADTEIVGAQPLELHPGRPLTGAVQPPVMSFGDGNHRCPGSSIALLESDVFLSRLLRLDLRAKAAPEIRWNDLTEGYELRRFVVSAG